jgi:hypothetical protein
MRDARGAPPIQGTWNWRGTGTGTTTTTHHHGLPPSQSSAMRRDVPSPRCATSRWRGLAHAQALPCVLQVNVCSRPPVCTRLASSEVTWSTQMSRMRECELSRPEGEMSADAAAPTGEYQGKTGGLRFHVVAPVLPSSSHSARCTLAFSQHTPHHQRAQGTYK